MVNDSLCLWHLWQTLWVDFVFKLYVPIIYPCGNPVEVNPCHPTSPLLLLHPGDHQVALSFNCINCIVHQSSVSVPDSIDGGVENFSLPPSALRKNLRLWGEQPAGQPDVLLLCSSSSRHRVLLQCAVLCPCNTLLDTNLNALYIKFRYVTNADL